MGRTKRSARKSTGGKKPRRLDKIPKKIRFERKKKIGITFIGLRIESVIAGSQAETLGVRNGWKIIAINGKRKKSPHEIMKAISLLPENARLEISFTIPQGQIMTRCSSCHEEKNLVKGFSKEQRTKGKTKRRCIECIPQDQIMTRCSSCHKKKKLLRWFSKNERKKGKNKRCRECTPIRK